MRPYEPPTDTAGDHPLPEHSRGRVNGQFLARLSGWIYLFGFFTIFFLSVGNAGRPFSGLGVITLASLASVGCLAASILLMIAASITYPRALLLLPLHIATLVLMYLVM